MNNKYFIKNNSNSQNTLLAFMFFMVALFTPNFAHAFDLSDLSKYLGNLGTNSSVTIGTIFGNLDSTIRVLIAIVVMLARIISVFLVFKALYRLIRASEQKETMGGVWFTLISATFMFSLIQFLDMFTESFGMGSAVGGLNIINGTSMVNSPQGCSIACAGLTNTNNVWEHTSKALIAIIGILRLAGLIAFVRGILAIHELSNNRGQATYGKIFLAMASGAILYNIVPFTVIVLRTIAPGMEGFFLDGNGRVFLPN